METILSDFRFGDDVAKQAASGTILGAAALLGIDPRDRLAVEDGAAGVPQPARPAWTSSSSATRASAPRHGRSDLYPRLAGRAVSLSLPHPDSQGFLIPPFPFNRAHRIADEDAEGHLYRPFERADEQAHLATNQVIDEQDGRGEQQRGRNRIIRAQTLTWFTASWIFCVRSCSRFLASTWSSSSFATALLRDRRAIRDPSCRSYRALSKPPRSRTSLARIDAAMDETSKASATLDRRGFFPDFPERGFGHQDLGGEVVGFALDTAVIRSPRGHGRGTSPPAHRPRAWPRR